MKTSQNEKNLLILIKYGAVLLIILFSFIITSIFINQKKAYLKKELQTLEKTYVEQKKTELKNLVNRMYTIVEVGEKNSFNKLKEHIKEEVYSAHAIATSIYHQNKKSENYSKEKTITQIKETLRAVNFNNGNGYIYLLDTHGNTILHKIKELEGKNLLEVKDSNGYQFIKTIISTLHNKSERFDVYNWYKGEDKSKSYTKIGFYKYFEPYNFAIGTGAYLVDFEEQMKDRVIKQLNAIKFDEPKYLLIYDLEGKHLVNSKKRLKDKTKDHLKNGEIEYTVKENIHFALKNKEGFRHNKESKEKISFFKLFDRWKWIVESRFYLEELHSKLDKKRKSLEQSNKDAIQSIMAISLILTLLIILISFYLSHKTRLILRNYKNNLFIESQNREKEILKNAQLYQDLFESNQSIILLINPQSNAILNANKSACKFYGYKREKLLSMNISEINNLSKEEIEKEINRAKKSRREYYNFVHKKENGELKNVRVTNSNAQYLGIPVIFSVIVDTSQEYQIKEQLEDSEQEFKTLFESSNIGLALRNKEGKFIKVNKKLLTMLDYDESFILNKTCQHISHKEQEEKENHLFQKLLNKEITNYNIEKKFIRKDGSSFEAILTMASVLNKEGEIIDILSSIIDISELKKKEQLLIQQSKMATMGEMIGSIAHQWKQPLSLISMSNGMIQLSLGEDKDFVTQEDLISSVNDINTAVVNLTQTIDDFRNFFNPNKERKLFPVENALDDTFKLIGSQLKNNTIEVIKDIQSVQIFASQNELQQVLINLLKNAKEELVKKEASFSRLLFIGITQENNNAIIKVKDNAGGIPLEIITRIFEPYFTTKRSQKGTGIGLYMSKQIIEESMKGKITVSNVEFTYENSHYHGAEFTLVIPIDSRKNAR